MDLCQSIVKSSGCHCVYKSLPGLNTCGVHRPFVETTCAICLDEVSTKVGSKRLKCGHTFHNKCITEWLDAGRENSHCCALCRTPWRRPVAQPRKVYMVEVEPDNILLEIMRETMTVDRIHVDTMDPADPEPVVLDGIFPDGGSLFIRMTVNNWRYLIT